MTTASTWQLWSPATATSCQSVESVRERFPRKRVIVASPPKRWSTDLAQSAHAAFQVSRAVIRSNRLPDPVITPEGVELRAPAGWLPPTV